MPTEKTNKQNTLNWCTPLNNNNNNNWANKHCDNMNQFKEWGMLYLIFINLNYNLLIIGHFIETKIVDSHHDSTLTHCHITGESNHWFHFKIDTFHIHKLNRMNPATDSCRNRIFKGYIHTIFIHQSLIFIWNVNNQMMMMITTLCLLNSFITLHSLFTHTHSSQQCMSFSFASF